MKLTAWTEATGLVPFEVPDTADDETVAQTAKAAIAAALQAQQSPP